MTSAQEAMAESLRPLHDQIASPPKLSQGPSLIPVKDILGDRLQFHPSGKVLLQVSPDYAVVFRDETHLDAVLEMVDRERSPGRDPWVPSNVSDYQAEVRRLRDEREGAAMTDLLMPKGAYRQVRSDEFDLLATHAQVRPLDLRAALSNVFVAMACRRGSRYPFLIGERGPEILSGAQR